MYMQNTVSLEEELRKANAARSQLETYKRQVRTDIVNATVLCIVQYFPIITWLIPQRKKDIMNKQPLCLEDFHFLQLLPLSCFSAITIIISGFHQFSNKRYFLLLKIQQMCFAQISPNSYSVAKLELELPLSEKMSNFCLQTSSSEECTTDEASYSCG